MRKYWLKLAGAHELIVVFGGWALGSAPFSHLRGKQDILFVEDYRQLDADLSEIHAYGDLSLLAFSYGVASAAHWIARHGDPFRHKVAVNGTLYPTDPERGIPEDLVRQTAQELSSVSLRRFARRCGAAAPPEEIDISALSDELLAICTRGTSPTIRFDQVWLSTGDRIFPPANMARGWAEGGTTPKRIEAPHAPFARWSHWDEILA